MVGCILRVTSKGARRWDPILPGMDQRRRRQLTRNPESKHGPFLGRKLCYTFAIQNPPKSMKGEALFEFSSCPLGVSLPGRGHGLEHDYLAEPTAEHVAQQLRGAIDQTELLAIVVGNQISIDKTPAHSQNTPYGTLDGTLGLPICIDPRLGRGETSNELLRRENISRLTESVGGQPPLPVITVKGRLRVQLGGVLAIPQDGPRYVHRRTWDESTLAP